MKKLGFDLFILGSPVSGKNTQADLLLTAYSLKDVRSRNLMKKMDFKKISLASSHLPVSSKIVDDFMKKSIQTAPKHKHLLFVGLPRLKKEAMLVTRLLKAKNRDYLVLFIKIPNQVIYQRAFHRDRDKHDMDLSYLKNKATEHRKQVLDTINYFKKLKKLIYINGNKPVFAVAKDIGVILDNYRREKK